MNKLDGVGLLNARDQDIIVIIPARGGSKRIKGKNIKIFYGEPILAKTINTLKNMMLFENIVVSTDSSEIKTVAESCGAIVPFMRPPEFSNDDTTTLEVIKHALNSLRVNKDFLVFCVYPTSVFINQHIIQKAIVHSLNFPEFITIPVKKFPSPIERRLQIDETHSRISIYDPATANISTQNFQKFWYDISEFYLAKAITWMQAKDLYTKSVGFDVKNHLTVDINDLDDWEMAEEMFVNLKFR